LKGERVFGYDELAILDVVSYRSIETCMSTHFVFLPIFTETPQMAYDEVVLRTRSPQYTELPDPVQNLRRKTQ
jgi:hypothetical protein